MSKKSIPEFETEAEEQLFWRESDSADYVDWSEAEAVTLPELRPSPGLSELDSVQQIAESGVDLREAEPESEL